MRVMQVNVWQGRLIRPLLDMVAAVEPDIILTQEIYTYPSPIQPTSPWNFFGTLEFMAQRGDLQHYYFSPSSTFSMFNKELGYGNAVLSRYPILESTTHYTSDKHAIRHEDLSSLGGNDSRNFQHLVLELDGRRLNVINHHGHWVNQPLGDDVSTQRLRTVASYINGLIGPVIVGGDFNLLPTSPAMSEFIAAAKLRDVRATSTITTTLSAAHYLREPIVCDYILGSADITISQLTALQPLVSDHKALLAEVTV
jgi:endonuclease/exonuclease/phosphatase family metal-dependent hydrolase